MKPKREETYDWFDYNKWDSSTFPRKQCQYEVELKNRDIAIISWLGTPYQFGKKYNKLVKRYRMIKENKNEKIS